MRGGMIRGTGIRIFSFPGIILTLSVRSVEGFFVIHQEDVINVDVREKHLDTAHLCHSHALQDINGFLPQPFSLNVSQVEVIDHLATCETTDGKWHVLDFFRETMSEKEREENFYFSIFLNQILSLSF
jgi:hypothetical protein